MQNLSVVLLYVEYFTHATLFVSFDHLIALQKILVNEGNTLVSGNLKFDYFFNSLIVNKYI